MRMAVLAGVAAFSAFGMISAPGAAQEVTKSFSAAYQACIIYGELNDAIAIPAAMTPERNETVAAWADEASLAPKHAEQLRPTGAPAPAPKRSEAQATSRVLGKSERTLVDGKRVCEVRFVYAGREPEEVFWEEPCAAVDARMMTRGELETLGRWERLDAFQQKFIAALPGGKVLYVGGEFSASVYPIDETGTSIEIAVAD